MKTAVCDLIAKGNRLACRGWKAALARLPITVAFIILLGFALRLFWWAYARPAPVDDAEGYRWLAENLVRHGQLGYPAPTAYRLPGWPVFLAGLMLFGHSILWLSFGAVALSTLLIYLVYRLALRLTSQASIAVLAAGLVAVNPTFVFYSPTLLSEHLLAVLMFMALLFSLGPGAAKEPRLPWWQWALSGACFGAAMLTRGDARLYLPVFAALCLVLHKWGKRAIANGLVWILALGLVVFPWVVRNRLVYGRWIGTSSMGGHIFYLGHNPGPRDAGHDLDGTTDLETSEKGYQLALQYIRDSSLKVLLTDVVRATREHYLRSGVYALGASTMVPQYSLLGIAKFPPPWEITMTPGRYTALSQVMWLRRLTYFYFVLLLGALISVCFSRHYSVSMWLSLYGMIALNGVGFCVVIGYGDNRFRYLAEVLFCVLTAVAVVEMAGRLERWRGPRDHGTRAPLHAGSDLELHLDQRQT